MTSPAVPVCRIHTAPAADPRPAIFLDRDGTLNFDHGWISSAEKIELLPGAADAVRLINQSGCFAVLVTNQPVIARGECSEAQLEEIHDRFEFLLAREGARLDAIYHCPHHPGGDFAHQRQEFILKCQCRKPAPGMILAAMHALNISPKNSWIIGDSARDVGAAEAAGISAVLVPTNQQALKSAAPYTPTLLTSSVLTGVQSILSNGINAARVL